MSWAHDYWADMAAAELDWEPIIRNGNSCPDCPAWAVEPRKLYDVEGAKVCSKHAAKREGITWSAWEERRKRQARRDLANPDGKRLREMDLAQASARGANSGPKSSSASNDWSDHP